jgi:hypothetical protein
MTQIKWFHAFLVFFLLRVVYLYEAHTTKKTKQEELAPKEKRREKREKDRQAVKKKTPLVYQSLKRAHAT